MRKGVSASAPPGAASAAGWVLAGGRSTRMGRDKALLELGGEPLLVRIARAVHSAAGSAVIVGDPARYGSCGFRVIADRVAGLGPIGGLLTSLENTSATWNLLVACDMPAVTGSILEQLLRHAESNPEARCIAPVSVRGPEPLCAVYHRVCLAEVRRAVEAKELRMTGLVTRLEPVLLPVSDPQVFENVNSPADWWAYQRVQG